MVSTTVVVGLRSATFTGMNSPVLASRPTSYSTVLDFFAMGNVLSFPGTRTQCPEVWVCNCGCLTFRLYRDGRVYCAQCNAETRGAGEYYPWNPHEHSNADVIPFPGTKRSGRTSS